MALTDTQARFLDELPIYYGGSEDPDPVVARWEYAAAVEADRLRALLEALRDESIPSKATDRFGALSRWERTLKLPVAPAGVSEAQRRAKVVARLIGRRVARGIDWHNAVTTAIGSDQWTVQENTPGPNQLTVQIPYAAGSYNAGQVEELIRDFTPANQQIVMRYDQGFIVGVSRVGLDAI